MKKTLTFLFSLSFLISWSQNFSKNSIDGQLFFKIKDSEPIVIKVDNNTRVAQIDDAVFLNNIRQKYNITGLSSPFYFKNTPKLLRIYRLYFEDYMLVDSIIKDLSKLPNIEFAEREPRYKAFFVPNDPLYTTTSGAYNINWNWHLDKIKAKEAWDISTGSSSIKVAVVDNAVWYSHPDLSSKIVAKYDAANSDNDPSPPASATGVQAYYWSHGTHSSGLVGAATNNGIGVASIGYNTSLIAVKTTKNTEDPMYMTAIAEGIQWAANNGADVISMSFGGPDNSAAYQTFITSLHDAGIVLVAAAGNNGDGGEDATNPNYICYPAANTYVIAVGSTNEDDKRSGFSEYGTWLDVSAPGGYSPNETTTGNKINILSTTFCDTYNATPAITGKYDIMLGTSMACPIVAGLCGLMLSVNPALTPAQLETCLKSSCDNIDALNPGFTGKLGSGRINAQAALQCVGGSVTLNANFSASSTNINVGGSVTFTNSSTGNPTSWAWSFPSGTPSSYNGQTPPAIQYNTAGSFNVSLTISNGSTNDTETKAYYIVVSNTVPSTCDTITNILNSELAGLTYYGFTGQTGTWAGHNGYNETEFADKFTNSGTKSIKGIFFVPQAATAGNASSKLTFHVYSDGTTPGSALVSKDVLMSSMTVDTWNYVQFNSPVAVSGNYFLGYQIYYVSGDNFALYMATNRGSGTATAYSKGTSWSAFSDYALYTSLALAGVVCGSTGIDDNNLSDENNVIVFPNPSSGLVNVLITETSLKPNTIKVYDIYGKAIESIDITDSKNNSYQIDLNGQAKGLYIISIEDNNKKIIRKVSLQ